MGRERGASYYDQHCSLQMLPLEQSPWRNLYLAAFSLIAECRGLPVADLGCGTGRFAKLLQRGSWADYWGVDFSQVRIEEARRYVPGFHFTQGHVLDPYMVSRYKEFQVFVLLELLEHLDEDLLLLKSIPAGAKVVFSVPNFDDPAHVRWFEEKASVVERYRELLDFKEASWIVLKEPATGRKSIFLCRCLRQDTLQEEEPNGETSPS